MEQPDKNLLGRLVPAIRIGAHQWTGQTHEGHFEVSRQIPYHLIDQAEHNDVKLGFYDHEGDRFYHLHELTGVDSSEHLSGMRDVQNAQHEVREGADLSKTLRRARGNDFIRRVLGGESIVGVVEGIFPSLKTTAMGAGGNSSFGFKGSTQGGSPTPIQAGKKKTGVRYRDTLHHVVDGAGKTEFRVYGKRDQEDLKKKRTPLKKRRDFLPS